MKHDGHVETEMKFRVPDLEAAARDLRARGFREAVPAAEERSVLWDRDGALRAAGCALRLRTYGGRAFLTWKGPREEDPLLKIRPEVETGLEDPRAMAGILAALGYAPWLEMTKRRALLRRGALEACLDETPFGTYLELEGEAAEIRAEMAALGLGEDQVETRSYPALFLEHGGGRP
ncbi:MAG TPA: class IV adenylate cyclase [Holophaga sp.]|nr:class IV adenylate cyclase [Holophaga sp.]